MFKTFIPYHEILDMRLQQKYFEKKTYSPEELNERNIEEILNNFCNKLSKVFPFGYNRIFFYGLVEDSSFDFIFYAKIGDKLIQCFDLEKEYSINKSELKDTFKECFKLISPLKKEMGFDVIKINLSSSGKVTSDFEYDIKDVYIKNREEWKKAIS